MLKKVLILKNKRKNQPATEKTISLLKTALESKNAVASVHSLDEIDFFLETNNISVEIAGKSITDWNIVYLRKVGEYKNVAFMLSRYCNSNGIRIIDDIYNQSNESEKLELYFLLSQNKIPIPKTYFSLQYDDIKLQKATNFLGFPVVVKAYKYHGGKGVFLAKNINDLRKILTEKADEHILLQEFIENDFDYRILVLGNEVKCAKKRIRDSKEEFRNNVALGAEKHFLDISELSQEMIAISKQSASVCNIQVAGVDLVTSRQNRHYVLEVNTMPAFTHDQSISPEINLLAEYLIECAGK